MCGTYRRPPVRSARTRTACRRLSLLQTSVTRKEPPSPGARRLLTHKSGAPATPRPRVHARTRRQVSASPTPQSRLSPPARPAAFVDPPVVMTLLRNTRFSSAACASSRVRHDGSTAPLSRGERSLGQGWLRPPPRHKRASGACSLRASALIEAVVRARRRCPSQGGDDRHRPPNRALLLSPRGAIHSSQVGPGFLRSDWPRPAAAIVGRPHPEPGGPRGATSAWNQWSPTTSGRGLRTGGDDARPDSNR